MITANATTKQLVSVFEQFPFPKSFYSIACNCQCKFMSSRPKIVQCDYYGQVRYETEHADRY